MTGPFRQSCLIVWIFLTLLSRAGYPDESGILSKLQQLVPDDAFRVYSNETATDKSFIQCLITLYAHEQIALWQQHLSEKQDHCTPDVFPLMTDSLSSEQLSARNNLKKRLKINFSPSTHKKSQKKRASLRTFEPWLDFLESNEFPRYSDNIGISSQKGELDYRQIINSLNDLGKQKTLSVSKDKSFRVSLLIGSSSMISSLPELAQISDLVIQADFHPHRAAFFNSVSRHLPELFDESQNASSLEDRERNFLLIRIFGLMEQHWIYETPPAEIEHEVQALLDSYQNSRSDTACLNPYSSEGRWQNSARAVQHLQFSVIYIDMFDNEGINLLVHLLKESNSEITYLNMSNTLSWLTSTISELVTSGSIQSFYTEKLHILDSLPFHPSARIAWSLMSNQTRLFFDEGSRLNTYGNHIWESIATEQINGFFNSISRP